jgi:hypothetical protein
MTDFSHHSEGTAAEREIEGTSGGGGGGGTSPEFKTYGRKRKLLELSLNSQFSNL